MSTRAKNQISGNSNFVSLDRNNLFQASIEFQL